MRAELEGLKAKLDETLGSKLNKLSFQLSIIPRGSSIHSHQIQSFIELITESIPGAC